MSGLYICESCLKSYGLRDSGAHSCVSPCDICVRLKNFQPPVWCYFTHDLTDPAKSGVTLKEQLNQFGGVQEKITRRLQQHGNAQLKLLVLRTAKLEAAKDFYALLGIDLQMKKHGNGPHHYAGTFGEFVFELYPSNGNHYEDHQVRLGFQVSGLNEILSLVVSTQGGIVKQPHDTPHGRKAVIKDPDGRSVELYEKTAVPA